MSIIFSVDKLAIGYKKIIAKDISFTGNEGEIIGILGANGSGKSTLLGALCGINKVFSGAVTVNNVDICKLSTKDRAKYISYYTQRTPQMDGFLVHQIIEMGLYAQQSDIFGNTDNGELATAAKIFGVEHLLHHEYHKLSEGQRSMVFLAKTFAQNTPVILLDEPDNNLDYSNMHYLFSAFREQVISCNKCGVVVLHNPSLALNFCDKIIIFSGGTTSAPIDIISSTTQELESLLKEIYPELVVRKDEVSGMFYSLFDINSARKKGGIV